MPLPNDAPVTAWGLNEPGSPAALARSPPVAPGRVAAIIASSAAWAAFWTLLRRAERVTKPSAQ